MIHAMTETEKQYWQDIATDFWKEIEKEAEELEVTVDYYMEEFFTSRLKIKSTKLSLRKLMVGLLMMKKHSILPVQRVFNGLIMP